MITLWRKDQDSPWTGSPQVPLFVHFHSVVSTLTIRMFSTVGRAIEKDSPLFDQTIWLEIERHPYGTRTMGIRDVQGLSLIHI